MKQPVLINYFMVTIVMLSSIMAICSTNMFMVWFSLELNMFFFMPILLNNMTVNNMEASMIYFFSQSLGSSLFLMSSMLMSSSPNMHSMSIIFMLLSMLLKMGAAPCHFWYPMVMEMSNWFNCLLLSTWQKMVPLFLLIYLSMFKQNSTVILLISVLNSIIGGMMGISQTSMKKIMAYSSITHTGWMIVASVTDTPCMSMTYLIVYSSIIIPLFNTLNKNSINKIHYLWSSKTMSVTMMMMVSIMLFSLGGLPPLSGFIPKFMVLKSLMKTSNMVVVLMIFGSLMNLFFYMNITLNILISNSKTKKNTFSMKNGTFMVLIFNLLTMTIIVL